MKGRKKKTENPISRPEKNVDKTLKTGDKVGEDEIQGKSELSRPSAEICNTQVSVEPVAFASTEKTRTKGGEKGGDDEIAKILKRKKPQALQGSGEMYNPQARGLGLNGKFQEKRKAPQRSKRLHDLLLI